MSNSNQKERNIISYILKNQSAEIVKSDEDLGSSDTRNLSEHNNLYTKLLKLYIDGFEKSYSDKLRQRKCMTIVSIILLLLVSAFSVITTLWALYITEYNSARFFIVIPELITALGSLAGAYIVLPKIIIKYLFNKNEEKNMAIIIGKIQDYDSNIRNKRKESES